MICRHIFKIFSILQLKSIQFFDHVPYWREEAGMKKKKVKHDKKRFPKDSIVPFQHEKRLRSFLEFIPGNKKKKNGEKPESKDLWKKYEENKSWIRSEFGLKKKIDMYMEQAERET